MARQSVITRKKRGPPATGKGELVGVRIQPKLMQILDGWIADQVYRPSRPEAIRRLLERALGPGKGARRPPNKEAARKASKLAARELEALGDQSQHVEEQARRKRTLIRGPKEFRDIRADLPKPKS
jgi:hypothetical protein